MSEFDPTSPEQVSAAFKDMAEGSKREPLNAKLPLRYQEAHPAGLRIPGLPEGLEIVGISKNERELLPADTFVLGRDGCAIYNEIKTAGMVLVRALPGYQIRYDIQSNRNVVVKLSATPNVRRFSFKCVRPEDSALVSRAMRHLSGDGVEVAEEQV